MRSYTLLRNTYGVDTRNSGATNLTQGDEWINDFHRKLLSLADWPFLHRKRIITSVAPSSTFTAVAATDLCTAATAIVIETGIEVTVSSGTTLPAGLSASTRYFMIYQSSTTFQLATTYANALAGTEIDITDAGTGTHTVTLAVHDNLQPLPYDIDLVESVTVVSGSTRYVPVPAPSKKFWDELHYTSYNSDTPQYWWVENGRIGLWPRHTTAGEVIIIFGKLRVPELNIADYTTGNIDIVTNGSLEVTGAGSPGWTTPMVGRWLRVTHSNTAASSGDHEWYEIVAVESATVLTLGRPYGGRTLATGAAAAYIIGQMPLLPEAYQNLPEIYGAMRYWIKESDAARVKDFRDLLTTGVSDLFKAYSINDTSLIVDDGEEDFIINPNLTVQL